MRRDTVILMWCVAVLSASPRALAGQTVDKIVETTAVSEFRASWEAPDRLATRSITRRFSPLQVSGLRAIADYFLLTETFDIHQITPAEGVQGVVSASLRPLRPEGIGDPLWSVEARGSEAALMWSDRLYNVTDLGCCGARSTHAYFSLLTGSELFRGDGSLPRIGTPLGPRFVSFHSPNASYRSVERERDSTVVGVLYYGDNQTPASRLILTSERDIFSGSVSLLVNGSETQQHTIRSGAFRRPARNEDPSLVGGFSILVELLSLDSGDLEPVRIEIPIVSDSFAVDRARLAKGIQIRRGDGAGGH